MESRYFCEICGTTPDQLSHHKTHLQSQKHKYNCENFIIDMKIFSICFRQIHPKKWHESEYKDYIIAKYLCSTNESLIDNDIITKWICNETLLYGNTRYSWDGNCFNRMTPMACYENESNCKLEHHDINKLRENTDYIDWAINKVLKYKETIHNKPIRKMVSRGDTHYSFMLSKHTNIPFYKLRDIRNGLIDLRYLLNPIATQYGLKNCDMEIYNDEIVRYSCLLFDRFCICSLYLLYNGACGPIDIEEHPEERKDNSFYFYKEVEIEHSSKITNVNNYGETRIEKKKIWVSCYMGDFIDWLNCLDEPNSDNNVVNYSYISNDDFKYFIKESLIEIFSGKLREVEYIEIDVMRTKYKNKRVIYDNVSESHFFLENNESVYSRNGIMYIGNIHTGEEREASLNPKLTKQETKEYMELLEYNEKLEADKEFKIKYFKMELEKIKNMSVTSDIIKSIMHVCQYLFEYNVDLIEYHKTHMSIQYSNIEKERMENVSYLLEEI